MSPRRVKRMFRYYNRRYWQGRLPDYRIRFERLPISARGEMLAWCDTRRHILRFDPTKIHTERRWRKTLLHEMSHVLSRAGHGKQFLDQLCRGPKYVVLDHCLGNKDAFAVLKYGPYRASAAARRLGIFQFRASRRRR